MAVTSGPPPGMNFYGLAHWVVRRGKPSHVKPRTFAWAAGAAGLSKQHVFNLMSGKRRASPVCVAKIARGWDLDVADVVAALERTRCVL